MSSNINGLINKQMLVIALGARPEIIKLATLIAVFKEKKIIDPPNLNPLFSRNLYNAKAKIIEKL